MKSECQENKTALIIVTDKCTDSKAVSFLCGEKGLPEIPTASTIIVELFCFPEVTFSSRSLTCFLRSPRPFFLLFRRICSFFPRSLLFCRKPFFFVFFRICFCFLFINKKIILRPSRARYLSLSFFST